MDFNLENEFSSKLWVDTFSYNGFFKIHFMDFQQNDRFLLHTDKNDDFS